MKLGSIYIPIQSLNIGDIIKLDLSLVYIDTKEKILFSVISKKQISDSLWKIFGITDKGIICETRPISGNICLEIVSYAKRVSLPCFVRNLETGDMILDPNTGSIVPIFQIFYNQQQVHISYIDKYHPISSQFVVREIRAFSNDLILIPTIAFGPLLQESTEFQSNLDLLVKSSSIFTNPVPDSPGPLCSFSLFYPCPEKADYLFHDKPLCINCAKKACSISVYGDSTSIERYKEFVKKYT